MVTYFKILIIILCPSALLAQGAWFCSDSSHCKTGVNFRSLSRGLELEYDNLPGIRLNTISNDPRFPGGSAEINNNRRISFKIKAPVVNKPGFKMLIGLKYRNETFTFEDYQPENGHLFESLQQKNLKTIGFDIYTLKPFKGKTYLALLAGLNFSGDFKGFLKPEQKYLSYRVAALFGIKKNENVEVAFGMAYSRNLGYDNFLPLVKYDHTFSRKLGLEAMLPSNLQLRYNLSEKTTLRFGMKIKGTAYQIGIQDPGNSDINSLRFNRSYVLYGIEIDHMIADPLYFTASIGYMQNLNFNFTETGAARGDHAIQSNGGGSMYFKVGLFITTPKRWR